jgi:hypothetical protein
MNGQELTQEETDAAKRMADAVNLHVHARLESGSGDAGYVAIRLSDGRSPDGEFFPDRKSVFRDHPHERNIFAVKIGVETMPEREAVIVLQMARMAYKRGVIFSEEEVVTPHLSEQMLGLLPRTLGALKNGRN